MLAYLALRGILGGFGLLVLLALIWWALPALLALAAAIVLIALLRVAIRRAKRRRAALRAGLLDAQRLADQAPDTIIVHTAEGRAAVRSYARGVHRVLPHAAVLSHAPGGAHRGPSGD